MLSGKSLLPSTELIRRLVGSEEERPLKTSGVAMSS